MIGNAAVYGNIVCKPAQLTEVKEKQFFEAVQRSINKTKIERLQNFVPTKANLKKGITIGNDYFIIERK